MTPAEHARLIEQQEFEAECNAARLRAQRYVADRRREERERVNAWISGAPAFVPFVPAKGKRGAKPKLFTHQGQTKTIAQWAESIGVKEHAFRERLRSGMSLEKALTFNPKQSTAKLHTVNGVSKTLPQWAAHVGVPYDTLIARMCKGRTLAEALNPRYGRAKLYTTSNGESRTIAEWAAITGIPANTIDTRLRRGCTIDTALTLPARKGRGVVSELDASLGTGAGSALYPTPNITFAEKAENA